MVKQSAVDVRKKQIDKQIELLPAQLSIRHRLIQPVADRAYDLVCVLIFNGSGVIGNTDAKNSCTSS